jgi:hypothetical protein
LNKERGELTKEKCCTEAAVEIKKRKLKEICERISDLEWERESGIISIVNKTEKYFIEKEVKKVVMNGRCINSRIELVRPGFNSTIPMPDSDYKEALSRVYTTSVELVEYDKQYFKVITDEGLGKIRNLNSEIEEWSDWRRYSRNEREVMVITKKNKKGMYVRVILITNITNLPDEDLAAML